MSNTFTWQTGLPISERDQERENSNSKERERERCAQLVRQWGIAGFKFMHKVTFYVNIESGLYNVYVAW